MQKGDTIEKLTVLAPAEDYVWSGTHHYRQWRCVCECGREIVVREDKLKRGGIKSCGCQRMATLKNREKKVNYDKVGDCVVCTLTNGVSFIIDAFDYPRVKKYGWSYNRPRNYIFCNSKEINQMALSRFIMQCPAHLEVDHINHNRLDNRRCNLRIATSSENAANTHSRRNSQSAYKGVSFCKQTKLWRASIEYGNKQTTIGRFKSEKEAAKAYDLFAYKIHGSFALLNFPEHTADYIVTALNENLSAKLHRLLVCEQSA